MWYTKSRCVVINREELLLKEVGHSGVNDCHNLESIPKKYLGLVGKIQKKWQS